MIGQTWPRGFRGLSKKYYVFAESFKRYRELLYVLGPQVSNYLHRYFTALWDRMTSRSIEPLDHFIFDLS